MRTPRAVLDAITRRDGHTSAWTGQDCPELVPQHRQGGMGGSKSKHRLSNVVWLESVLNGLIESSPSLQAEAKERGIKISRHADPETIPVQYADGTWWLLRDDGTRIPHQTDTEPQTWPQNGSQGREED